MCKFLEDIRGLKQNIAIDRIERTLYIIKEVGKVIVFRL